jgi:hypothetical protein
VQHAGGHRIGALFQRGEQHIDLRPIDLAGEPAEACEENELELRYDETFDAEEEVVEAAVLKVVLDACAPRPSRSDRPPR